MEQIQINKAAALKPLPDPAKLVFGKVFTDHMFLMNYDAGKGWHSPRIEPYAALSLEPSCMVFHYAQEVFEGMKAYRDPEGGVRLFRPMDNVQRLNQSCERLCIPQLPEDLALEGIKTLVRMEERWVPSAEGTSLYVRPFVIATDASLGVHASHSYLFCVICCPVGAYYKEGLQPVKIYVEDEDVRAVRGGTGFTKCGGNYAASIRAGERAEEKGFSQVLWLDGVERKYIEEVGAMNVLFKIDGKVVTPKLNGSILPGITRRSCLDLLRDWGYVVEERLVTAQELFEAAEAGKLEEAWGLGHRCGDLSHRRVGLGGPEGHHQRRQDRRSEPKALRHPHRHPVGPGGGPLRLERQAVRVSAEKLLDWFFPRRCPFCGRVNLSDLPCGNCQKTLPWLLGPSARSHVEFIEDAVSALEYRGAVRGAVLGLKFGKKLARAKPLGLLIGQCVQDQLAEPFDLVSWPSLSGKHRRKRGFDQGGGGMAKERLPFWGHGPPACL